SFKLPARRTRPSDLCASPVRAHSCFFFFTDTAPSEIYTLSLHDALPICVGGDVAVVADEVVIGGDVIAMDGGDAGAAGIANGVADRKSTRLNSSHQITSYAVFCLKKKKEWPTEVR